MPVLCLLLHAGCHADPGPLVGGGPLVAVREGESQVLPVDATLVAGEGAPAWVAVTSEGLVVAPGCDVVQGHTGRRAFQVEVTADGRRELLQIVVEGSRDGACAPAITTWSIAAGAGCDAPPAAPLDQVCIRATSGGCEGAPATVAPGALCVAVETWDPAMPAWVRVTTDLPATLLGAGEPPDDGVTSATWAHPLADAPAVVGAFELVVDLYDGPPAPGDAPFASRRVPVQAGDPDQAFVEVLTVAGAPATRPVAVPELGVVTLHLVPWVFTDPPTPRQPRCVRVRWDDGTSRAKPSLRLRDAAGVGGECHGDDCTACGEVLELAVSPPFDAAPLEALVIELADDCARCTLDAEPTAEATHLAIAVDNTGDDVTTSRPPAALACVTRGDEVELVVVPEPVPGAPASSYVFRGWPLGAATTLDRAPTDLVAVTRATAGDVEPIIYGLFGPPSGPRTVEALRGGATWEPNPPGFLEGSSSIVATALGPVRAPLQVGATHLALGYTEAGTLRVELRCITDDCSAAPVVVDLGPSGGTRQIVEVAGAELTVNGAADPVDVDDGDDVVVVIAVDADADAVTDRVELRRIAVDWAAGTAAARPEVLVPTMLGPITGPVHELAVARTQSDTDEVVMRLGPQGGAAAYRVDGLLTGGDSVVRIDAPGVPNGIAAVPGSPGQGPLIGTAFGTFQWELAVTGLTQRDPVILDHTDPGVLDEQDGFYGVALAGCRADGGVPRAAWVVRAPPPGATEWTIRIAELDAAVAGPWP